MSADNLSLKETQKEWHGTLKSYLIGFTLSLILTAVSFLLVSEKLLSGETLIVTIVLLALVQAFVQLRFLLHVGQEAHPRWESLVFYFMMLILIIIALGSLWIIHDLNKRVMPEMSEMKKEAVHD